MSMTRLGSDHNPPQRNWTSATFTQVTGGVPQHLTAVPVIVQQAVFYVPLANVSNVALGPKNTDVTLTKGAAPFALPCNAGASFDLAAWSMNSATTGDTLIVWYQLA